MLPLTNKNKTIIILLILLVSIPAFLLYKSLAKSKQPVKPVTPVYLKNVTYSRLTFFNTQKIRASLAVPSYWEGNYRLKEEGGAAKFYCINKESNALLFSITFGPDNQQGTEIFKKDKVLFFLAKNKKEDFSKDDFCTVLYKDIDEVIKTFKVS